MDNLLVGTWRLVSWRRLAADGSVGYPFGTDALGWLVYTADGFMAATVARARRPPFAASDIGDWMGADQQRAVLLDGDRLTPRTSPILFGGSPTEHQLDWERLSRPDA